MYRRLSLRPQRVTNKIFGEDSRKGKCHPGKKECGTDLPHDVERKLAVIPDAKPEPYVVDKPAAKLRERYERTAQKYLKPERGRYAEEAVETADPKKTDAAEHKHGRVGVPAVNDLDKPVYKAAHQKNHE